MTQLTTIDTSNFAAMAKAMGIANEGKLVQALAHLLVCVFITAQSWVGRGQGQGCKCGGVEGGTYKLEIPDGPTYYAPTGEDSPIPATLYV